VWRLRPRENEAVNECWICDDGAYSYRRIHEGRVTSPKTRNGDVWAETSWADALSAAAKLLHPERDGRPVGVVLSPQATCEDNWAFVRLAREVLSTSSAPARFYLGGRASWAADALLKSADANPNTLGARLVAGAGVSDAAALRADIEASKLRAALVLGHELPDAKVYDAFRKAPAVVAVTSHESALLELAHVFLPGVSHAEKDGVFVNGEGRAQRVRLAVEPRGRAAPEWKIALKLAAAFGVDFGWSGPEVIFREIAEQVPAFAALSWPSIGARGAMLEGYAAPDPHTRIGVALPAPLQG
jgi:NADH-quinone oxidoreductase subunit G